MHTCGHRVLLVARRGTRRSGEPLPELPCEIRIVPRGSLPGFLQRVPQVDEGVYDARLASVLAAEAARFEPDLVYERFSLYSAAGMRLARRLGVPGVLEVNAPLSEERARHEGLSVGPFTRRRQAAILRSATRVVVVSSALAEFVRGQGVPDERIAVIPNGVDAERFRPGLQPLPDVEPLARAFTIGFCGSLKAWHDLGTLLEALACSPDVADARLLVVGDGPAGDALRRRAEEAGVSGRVTWLGRRPEGDVPRLLSACAVICVPAPADPAHYFSPLKLLEAMALGRPVIASDVGDVGRVVGGEDPAALLVPPGDAHALAAALLRLRDEPGLAARLGHAGRGRAELHTWQHVVSRSLEGL